MPRRASCVCPLLFVLLASLASRGGFAQTPVPATKPTEAPTQQRPIVGQPQAPGVGRPEPAVPARQQSIGGEQQTQPIDAVAKKIEEKCGVNLNELNTRKVNKANLCVYKANRARQQRMRLESELEETTRLEALKAQRDVALGPEHGPAPGPVGVDQAAGGGTPAQATPLQNFIGGSLSGTPSTCAVGNAIGNAAYIRVHRDILTPQTSADDFGYRLGHRFIVYQVTVENGSKDYQFMLQDVTIDFSALYGAPAGTDSYKYSASGQDLMLLRGVPEKGEDLDPRNKVLHILQGIGSVAGAVSGLTSFADVMGPSVAVFNGSFLQGYTGIAPDHTSTQLNRLSDSAFTANTVVDKQRAKTIAMFIPADEILSTEQQQSFWSNPYTFIGFQRGRLDGILNKADICVDGTFIQAVTVTAPTLSSVAFGPGSSQTQNTDAVLNVTGANMVGGDTILVASSAAVATTAQVVASADGKTGTVQLHLPTDYDPAKTTFTLQSKSNATLNSGAGVKLQIVAPTLTTAMLEKTPAPAVGQPATLDVTGTNLINGDTQALVGSGPLTVPVTVATGGTTGKATFVMPADYVLGTTTATLQSKSTVALMSAAVKLQVAQ
ncbi:MAG: hypothetical protein M3O31_02070 [Acidobacteriota bacterium]|nr:hypothetical protein [Acidobacteriota bacterium]